MTVQRLRRSGLAVPASNRRQGPRYVDFHDPDGYLEPAQRAKLLGFEGRWCIHPNQIEWANAEFTPSRKLYDEAEGCLRPYTEAAAAGRAAGLRGQDLLA
jgi:citrate lyase beta subunit